ASFPCHAKVPPLGRNRAPPCPLSLARHPDGRRERDRRSNRSSWRPRFPDGARNLHEIEPAGRLSRPIASLLVAHGTLLAYPLRSSRLALERVARPDTPPQTAEGRDL